MTSEPIAEDEAAEARPQLCCTFAQRQREIEPRWCIKPRCHDDECDWQDTIDQRDERIARMVMAVSAAKVRTLEGALGAVDVMLGDGAEPHLPTRIKNTRDFILPYLEAAMKAESEGGRSA